MTRHHSRALAAVVGIAALALAGCASTDSAAVPAGDDQEIAYPEIHALLPDEIAERGYITNMTQIPNAPLEFEDADGTLSGIDPELMDAVSEVLGVEIRTETTADFAALLPSLDSGRTDIVFSAVLSTDERRAAGYSFVDYFQSYTTFMVRADDAEEIASFGDLCGRTVTANKGTQYPELAEKVSEDHCVAEGLDPIDVLPLDQIPQQVTQLQQGRSDALIMGVEYEAYEMSKAEGEFALLDEQLDPTKYGIVALAENEQLLQAIAAALTELESQGVYQDILEGWNLGGSAVESFELRAAE
ncbi:polar amino acid transport system substrate-binding protein [Microbacterium ginsengiterrae]|uniref:Polar amino acid transport system substrate-binding protein n=1 Tax=Microbacterium ginsengiterrae TaxID=546115 RepID=A0A7W9CBK4_9MICO|nr:transporter substrate-binding domain-containing protein [Microbacterium ginsengiterrae]MBB5742568.1 polar amino acid transport system substrate-binding protein [Microbacterium ginsengiterrae]